MKAFLQLLFISLLFSSCAQVVAPTGGEKDIEPPVAIEMEPENESINFKAKKIVIDFDEFIQLRNLKDELIVSPPLKYSLESKVRGKSLELRFEDTLKENTTYVLNFGKAIVDLREGNPIDNFQYVFSTGPEIDSLKIEGIVIDAFSLKLEESVYVMLYPNFENDSFPMLDLPSYVGRTNKEGKFNITNIQQGTYKLFALKDINNNYLFDRPTEKIAFVEEPLKLKNHLDSLKLFTFLQDREQQFIKKQTVKETKLTLAFNKTLSSLSYVGVDTTLADVLILSQLNKTQDTATFWFNQMNKQRIQLAIFDDTLFADTIKFKIDSVSKNTKFKLAAKFPSTFNYYQPLSLTFNRPISTVDTSSIILLTQDSTKIDYRFERDSTTEERIFLNFEFEEDSSYRLVMLPNAVTDIYGNTIDSLDEKFKFNNPSDFGTLLVRISSQDSTQKIILLTNSTGKELRRRVTNFNQISFANLRAGEYGLKMIVDINENGKWDTGEFLENLQPEKVILFNESITVRSNWDKEIDWIILQ